MRPLIALMTCALAPLPASAQGGVPECYCTDTVGARIELGDTICLEVGGRAFMAQCQMSLNVPMWREVSQGCLSSSLDLPAMTMTPTTG